MTEYYRYFSTLPYHWTELVETLQYYAKDNNGSDWCNQLMYEIREQLWELHDYANE